MVRGIRWASAVDFIVLATAVYSVLRWGQAARALRIVAGVLALAGGSLLARQLGLLITSWVLNAANIVAIVALLVVFQSEFRRLLTRLDLVVRLWPRRPFSGAPELKAISEAAFSLAAARRGALIVIARQDPVAEHASGGVPLGGEVSVEILEAIFRKVSPVHDGAAIVEGHRISRVAAILPLSQRPDLPSHYGTRHRAGLGLVERCDAVVLAVSEERGSVCLMVEGAIAPIGTAEQLFEQLERLVHPVRESPPVWRAVFTAHLPLKAAALGLAALVWIAPLLGSGGMVRTVTVPIEFRRVPAEMEIADQSTATVQAQLRVHGWLPDAIGLGTLVARFGLEGTEEGSHTVVVGPQALDVPPGVTVERVSPSTLSFRLVRTPGTGSRSSR